MTLYKSHYRVESSRHPTWDYHSPSWYFVTICTKNRIRYFGSVKNKRMELSPIGKIARCELLKTPEIRNDVVIDAWVIMPDHIHVVYRILAPPETMTTPMAVTASTVLTASTVETHRCASLSTGKPAGGQKNQFGPQSCNLPAIVRGFKSMVKRWTNLNCVEFQWQARYHDHIIRNNAELDRIRQYIRNNEAAWGKKSKIQ